MSKLKINKKYILIYLSSILILLTLFMWVNKYIVSRYSLIQLKSELTKENPRVFAIKLKKTLESTKRYQSDIFYRSLLQVTYQASIQYSDFSLFYSVAKQASYLFKADEFYWANLVYALIKVRYYLRAFTLAQEYLYATEYQSLKKEAFYRLNQGYFGSLYEANIINNFIGVEYFQLLGEEEKNYRYIFNVILLLMKDEKYMQAHVIFQKYKHELQNLDESNAFIYLAYRLNEPDIAYQLMKKRYPLSMEDKLLLADISLVIGKYAEAQAIYYELINISSSFSYIPYYNLIYFSHNNIGQKLSSQKLDDYLRQAYSIRPYDNINIAYYYRLSKEYQLNQKERQKLDKIHQNNYFFRFMVAPGDNIDELINQFWFDFYINPTQHVQNLLYLIYYRLMEFQLSEIDTYFFIYRTYAPYFSSYFFYYQLNIFYNFWIRDYPIVSDWLEDLPQMRLTYSKWVNYTKGLILYLQNNYYRALHFFIQVESEILKKNWLSQSEKKIMSEIYMFIANIYLDLDNLELSRNFNQKSLQFNSSNMEAQTFAYKLEKKSYLK